MRTEVKTSVSVLVSEVELKLSIILTENSELAGILDYYKELMYTLYQKCTRKNAQVVTNRQQACSNVVPTTCEHDVFELLFPA
jgi:hypothetical protein